MISTNAGMRTSSVIRPRSKATSAFDATSTASVATPMPSPWVAAEVTASAGHSDSIWLNTTLLRHRPSSAMSRV